MTVLIAGILPVTAASAATVQTSRTSTTTAAAAWSPVGTTSAQHPWAPPVQAQFWGAYYYSANGVVFDPNVIPTRVLQSARPFVIVPSGIHTYRLVFSVRTLGTTASSYQLTDPDSVATVPAPSGQTTLEFIDTVDGGDKGTGWYWDLTNVDGDSWVFYSCAIEVQVL